MTTKELALAWFKALVGGDAETVVKLIAEDFRYFLRHASGIGLVGQAGIL